MKPEQYRAIYHWGRAMGSYAYYIQNQQEEAATDNAPIDAIYKRGDTWRTVRDLDADHPVRRLVEIENKEVA